MMEMVDIGDLKSPEDYPRVGSNPTRATNGEGASGHWCNGLARESYKPEEKVQFLYVPFGIVIILLALSFALSLYNIGG